MDQVNEIEVEVGPAGHTLRWTERFSRAPVDICTGPAPDAIDLRTPVARAAVGQASIGGLDGGLRHYFHLQPQAGAPIVVGPRHVPLEGGVNFRDLGGYATRDGRRVRWGRLFRSGHMAHLTAADRAHLATVDIRTVCDFRVAEELANERTQLPNDPHMAVLGIKPGIKDRHFFHRLFDATDDPAEVIEAVHQVLRSLITEWAPNYARMFEVLLECGDGAVVLNCSGGKERTGVGSALLLEALGVPRQTVRYDFMLSKKYFPVTREVERVLEKYDVRTAGRDATALIMPLLDTYESYLECVFRTIDENHRSTEAYMRHACGLGDAEFARLRDKFTV